MTTQLRIAAQLLVDTWDKHGGDPRPWMIRPNVDALRAAMDEKVASEIVSTQGPDHELQPAEPAYDLLEPQPLTLREKLQRFVGRDPWAPYTGGET